MLIGGLLPLVAAAHAVLRKQRNHLNDHYLTVYTYSSLLCRGKQAAIIKHETRLQKKQVPCHLSNNVKKKSPAVNLLC